ncbi:DUF1707 and DUF4190 domain-containing protein [Streptacidiphilus sp. EB129]|uniref:DUF1707 and DUF4190 domain-containing protein n=1 Tax=Streptacidiphilus sp. EB129 TaxID=3156262 RepID=UPI003516FA44
MQQWPDPVPLRKTTPMDRRQPPTGAAVPAAPGAATAMRASHADRERTVDVLKAAYAEGRLTSAEYDDRVELVYRSLTYGELSGLVADLPSGPIPVPYLTPAPLLPAAFVPYPPVYLGAPHPYPAPYANPFAAPPRRRRTNQLSGVALALAIAEIPTFGLTALPALICGHVARQQIRERDEEGDGMATTAVVLGWLGVALWVFVFLVAVLASHGDPGSAVPAPPPPGG